MATELKDPLSTHRPLDPRDELVIPRVSVLDSIRRHLLLFVIPALLFTALGVGIAATRTPTYTAEMRLQVGRIDVGASGNLAGFATATQALAATYSRSVDAAEVIRPVAERTDLETETVDRRLTAVAIPETSVFRVVGTDTNRDRAIAIANAGGESITTYVEDLNQDDPDGDRLFSRYKDAQYSLQYRDGVADRLKARFDEAPSLARRRALERARGNLEIARLRVDTLKQAFLDSQAQQSATALVQTLSRADSAKSDRQSKMQLWGFAGLLLGLAVGAALATMRANAVARRRLGF